MTKARQGRPPDGGWGWMVIAGAFLVMFTLAVFSLGFSIMFSEFLMIRGASSTTIAWIFNLHQLLWSAVGVFTGPMTKEFGFRRVSMTCCFLASLCVLLLVFADSLWYLLVFYALLGLFGGLGSKPSFLLLTLYFDRKRGRANAFLMTGACVAQFVGPLLIRYMLAEYSVKGATLIMAGIMLNSVVGGSLYQPVEWHWKKDDKEEEEEALDKLNNGDNEEDKDKRKEGPDSGVTEEMRVKEAERRRMFSARLSRRASEASMMSLAVSNIDLSSIPPSSRRGSFALENASCTSSILEDASSPSASEQGCLNASLRVINTVVSDIKILRSPRAVIIVLGAVVFISVYLNFYMMAPFVIQHHGYSLSEAAWCMSLAAIANFSFRLLTSALSDHRWFNIRLVYMGGAIIISLTTAIFGFLQDYTHLQVAMAVWGCGVGVTISLHILIMPHFMGAENMSAIYGVQSLATSFSMITLGPLFGMIRDKSGSYPLTLVTMGTTAGMGVLLWCLMPAAVAYDKRKEEEEEHRKKQQVNGDRGEAERKV